jgi:hypothetical protein
MASELYVETLKGLTSGANANKVIVPAGQTLDASAGSVVLPAGTGGKVLQVVTATSESAGATTSTSFVSYMSANITPSSTSSKILLMFSSPLGYEDSRGGSSFYHFSTFFRDSTDLGRSNGNGITGTYQFAVSYNDFPLNNGGMHLLDSPSTTSQITYSVRHRVNTSSASVRWNLDGVAHFTLMEIAG